MGWSAETMNTTIGNGTVLSIFQEPWGPDLPVCPLPTDVDVRISFADNSRTEARVMSVSQTEAIIRMRDGTKWLMTPATDVVLQRLPPAGTGGAPATYWVVRNPVEE
jgi:hypothetical protein